MRETGKRAEPNDPNGPVFHVVLLQRSGGKRGRKEISPLHRNKCTIGSGEECDITISRKIIEKIHMTIHVTSTQAYILARGSVTINDHEISRFGKVLIGHGTIFKVEIYEFMLEIWPFIPVRDVVTVQPPLAPILLHPRMYHLAVLNTPEGRNMPELLNTFVESPPKTSQEPKPVKKQTARPSKPFPVAPLRQTDKPREVLKPEINQRSGDDTAESEDSKSGSESISCSSQDSDDIESEHESKESSSSGDDQDDASSSSESKSEPCAKRRRIEMPPRQHCATKKRGDDTTKSDAPARKKLGPKIDHLPQVNLTRKRKAPTTKTAARAPKLEPARTPLLHSERFVNSNVKSSPSLTSSSATRPETSQASNKQVRPTIIVPKKEENITDEKSRDNSLLEGSAIEWLERFMAVADESSACRMFQNLTRQVLIKFGVNVFWKAVVLGANEAIEERPDFEEELAKKMNTKNYQVPHEPVAVLRPLKVESPQHSLPSKEKACHDLVETTKNKPGISMVESLMSFWDHCFFAHLPKDMEHGTNYKPLLEHKLLPAGRPLIKHVFDEMVVIRANILQGCYGDVDALFDSIRSILKRKKPTSTRKHLYRDHKCLMGFVKENMHWYKTKYKYRFQHFVKMERPLMIENGRQTSKSELQRPESRKRDCRGSPAKDTSGIRGNASSSPDSSEHEDQSGTGTPATIKKRNHTQQSRPKPITQALLKRWSQQHTPSKRSRPIDAAIQTKHNPPL